VQFGSCCQYHPLRLTGQQKKTVTVLLFLLFWGHHTYLFRRAFGRDVRRIKYGVPRIPNSRLWVSPEFYTDDSASLKEEGPANLRQLSLLRLRQEQNIKVFLSSENRRKNRSNLFDHPLVGAARSS